MTRTGGVPRKATEGEVAIVFDMDGVLLQGAATDPEVYRAAARDAVAELGIEELPESEFEVLAEPRYSERMAEACDALGIDRDAWWAARERHASRRTNERLREGVREPFGDVDIVEELAGRVPLGLASNNRQATVSFVATQLFGDAFEAVVGREPTISGYRRRKPEPDLVTEALTRLDAEGGLYVGDREHDLIAAERAGVLGVFVDRPHNQERTDLDVDPPFVIDSLSELPRVLDRIE
ncbi:MAG: HAD family hydrolase [Haloferacaceae archaeon]